MTHLDVAAIIPCCCFSLALGLVPDLPLLIERVVVLHDVLGEAVGKLAQELVHSGLVIAVGT